MPGNLFLKSSTGILLASALLSLMFGAGLASGVYFYPKLFPIVNGESSNTHSQEPEHHAGEEEHDHLDLSLQAAQNLQLELGRVQQGNYWKSILLPAQVVEIPGQSDLAVSAPVTGVVSRVDVLPGQSLKVNQPLFEIQLTDEALTDAQSKLLTTLTAQEVARQELERLRPLISSGAVSGIKSRELEYQLKQLTAEQAVLTQELLGRGLPKSTVDDIVSKRELATALTVYAPGFVQEQSGLDSTGYSVENLSVHPGVSIERGALLCSVAYHAELYVKGTAFEADLARLNRIAENDWSIRVELPQSETSTERTELGLVKLLRVDNHVSQSSQTVDFYARISNRITRRHIEREQSFEQWQFRPGQRLHLRLPVEMWQNQLVLPAAAVVVDGPNVFVFAQHSHNHSNSLEVSPFQKHPKEFARYHSTNPSDNSLEPVIPVAYETEAVLQDIELEPVRVRLLHRDDRNVIVADDGQLRPAMKIALNSAQALYLALKMQASSGGGHHHDHEH